MTTKQIFKQGNLIVKEGIELYESPTKLTSPTITASILRPLYESISYTEEFYILCLSRSHKVLKSFQISKGGISGTVVDPKVVFASALSVGASAIILSHNHPSGNMTPSNADDNITQKLKRGGELLDITILDHIILSGENNSFYSYANEGRL